MNPTELPVKRAELASALIAALAAHEIRSTIEVFLRRAGTLDVLYLRDALNTWQTECATRASEQFPLVAVAAQTVLDGRCARIVDDQPIEPPASALRQAPQPSAQSSEHAVFADQGGLR